jgi:hypothetical protein
LRYLTSSLSGGRKIHRIDVQGRLFKSSRVNIFFGVSVSTVGVIIGIVVGSIVTAPFLWLAGKWIVGSEKARFLDAVWIGVLGTVVNAVIGEIIGGGIGALAQLVAYLYLVKTYYETGWGNAVVISILAVVIMAVVLIMIGMLLGISLGGARFGTPF